MEITMTVEESAALQHALRSYHADLRMEIADTDNPGFRRDLRAEREALDGVLAKLDAAARTGVRDEHGRVALRILGAWLID